MWSVGVIIYVRCVVYCYVIELCDQLICLMCGYF